VVDFFRRPSSSRQAKPKRLEAGTRRIDDLFSAKAEELSLFSPVLSGLIWLAGTGQQKAYFDSLSGRREPTLVERGGKARSFHVKNATAKTLRETAVKIASRKSYLMTDENPAYTKLGKEFSGHATVTHSANEYVRLGGFVHVNSAENYFFIFKRGVIGTFHHISEQHLHRYLTEFDFRYNNRSGLGVEDVERAARTLKGIEGKRLTYRQPHGTAHA
jgi:hypothetical protein